VGKIRERNRNGGLEEGECESERPPADVARYALRRIDIQGDQLSSDGDLSKESNEEDRPRIVLHGHGLADMKDSVAHQARTGLTNAVMNNSYVSKKPRSTSSTTSRHKCGLAAGVPFTLVQADDVLGQGGQAFGALPDVVRGCDPYHNKFKTRGLSYINTNCVIYPAVPAGSPIAPLCNQDAQLQPMARYSA
jgi:hypothetical protein